MSNDLHHLAAAYALDALDLDERAAFEAHYPSCDVCSIDVADYRETAARLAESTAAPAPADLRAKVLREIGETRQISPNVPDRVVDLSERRRQRGRRAGLAAAAAAAIVAIVGVVTLTRPSTGSEIDDIIAAADAVVTDLDGAGGSLQVVWSAERDQVAVLGADFDDPGPGNVYALWLLLDEGVAPAGLFSPDDDGLIRTALDVEELRGVGFGVTIEPDGGSPQPTTDVILAGTI